MNVGNIETFNKFLILFFSRHAHKNTVMDAKWNKNGNWLLTASRDHLIKLFDIRNMNQEMQTFRGHKKEATSKGIFTRIPFTNCYLIHLLLFFKKFF